MDPLHNFSEYLSQEKRLSQHTALSYVSDLSVWKKAGLPLESLGRVDQELLFKILESFEKEALQEATLARRCSALRSFVRFEALREPKLLEWLKLMPTFRFSPSFPKALSLDEMLTFLDSSADTPNSPAAIRNQALIELTYASGLRVSEAIQLEWKHVDRVGMFLRIFGKGDKERIVPFTPRASQALELYRENVWESWAQKVERRYKDFVFLSHYKKPLTRMGAWKIISKRALAAGLNHVHPHMLRHSFATHLLQGGANLRAVQMLLGHESIGSTERYLKITDDELRKVFDEFHPLR